MKTKYILIKWLGDSEMTEIISVSDMRKKWLGMDYKPVTYISNFSVDTTAYLYVSQIYRKQNRTQKECLSVECRQVIDLGFVTENFCKQLEFSFE